MGAKKKRICLVIPSLGPGGMERVMSEIACYFNNKERVEVHLILYSRVREVFYPVPSSVFIHKPDFVFKNTLRVFYTIKTLFFLRKKIPSINPDVVLSFGENWNNFVLLSLLGLNYPVYISDRAQPGLKKKWIQEMLTKWLYPKASGIIVQTEVAKKIYSNIYANNNVVAIGNPIRKVCVNERLEKKEKIILSVGRLIDTKNFDLLIKIFSKIKIPGWKLIIVGGDSQRQNGMKKIKSVISELGMDEKVELTGTVSNVDDYYNKSSIFVFTSSSEGFPNVIGEALSAGVPVVAFDCIAGPSEMIEDGENGFLIPLFDQTIFIEKLKKLMEDEELRRDMGVKAKESIQDFDVNFIAEKFYNFIFDKEEERAVVSK